MYGSLRQLEALEMKNMLILKNLQENGLIDMHSPLVEQKGSKTAVSEHTL